eukprot:g1370.t1
MNSPQDKQFLRKWVNFERIADDLVRQSCQAFLKLEDLNPCPAATQAYDVDDVRRAESQSVSQRIQNARDEARTFADHRRAWSELKRTLQEQIAELRAFTSCSLSTNSICTRSTATALVAPGAPSALVLVEQLEKDLASAQAVQQIETHPEADELRPEAPEDSDFLRKPNAVRTLKRLVALWQETANRLALLRKLDRIFRADTADQGRRVQRCVIVWMEKPYTAGLIDFDEREFIAGGRRGR